MTLIIRMIELALLKGDQPVFNILRASAGSGKTFNLVRCYLTLCIARNEPYYYRHILAITFTNKAANEMKERVIKGMRELRLGEGGHLEAVASGLGLSPAVVMERAHLCYEAMMTGYGAIGIMTIDKFVNRLVRRFTREFDMDSDFRLELDQDTLIRESVDHMLSKVGPEHAQLTRVLETYALQLVDDEKSWDMRGELIKFGMLLFDEQVQPMMKEVEAVKTEDFAEIRKTYLKYIQDAENKAQAGAQAALDLIAQNGLNSGDFSRSFVPKYFEKIANRQFVEPSSTLENMFAGAASFYTKTVSAHAKLAIDRISPQLTEYFSIANGLLAGEAAGIYIMKKALLANIFQIMVLHELQIALNEVRSAKNCMTFSDLNRLIELLVRDNPAPFIFEQLGERYHHFLIDEFQDTSVVQWQNFLPLIHESLSKGNFNLIVGDGKQAIYRWRNGDVRQLQKLPEVVGRELTGEMVVRQEALQRAAVKSNLEDNWRSHTEVVAFNNQIFERLQASLDDQNRSIYDGSTQNAKGEEGGWVTAEAYFEQTDIHTHRMIRILELIDLNIAQGFAKKDIVILVRSNITGSRIARSLLAAGIPTITQESLQLGQHPGPLAVIALLEFLANRANMAAATVFIQCHSAFRHNGMADELTDREFGDYLVVRPKSEFNPRQTHRIDFERYLRERIGLTHLNQLTAQPLYDLVSFIVEKLKISAYFPAYAEALLQLAFEYQTDDNQGLPGFIEHWNGKGRGRSVAVPDDIDGVRIMTVHKSKGLEFPVVIKVVTKSIFKYDQLYPVALDPAIFQMAVAVVPFKALRNSWADSVFQVERQRRLLDDLNIVYVGCTRAAIHLHLLIEATEKSNDNSDVAVEQLLCSAINAFGKEPVQSQRVSFGEPVFKETLKKESVKEPMALIEVRDLNYTINPDRLKVSVDQPTHQVADGQLSRRQLGDELHALAARMRSADDLQAIRKSKAPWQRMSASEWIELLELAERMVNHPAAKAWFAAGLEVHNERELVSKKGEIFRPDRIVVYPDRVVVIDFKTGKAKEAEHKKQLKSYGELLKEIETKPVEGWLFYTDQMEAIQAFELQ
jgi:ATP-dependent exoDNAse (exonuclease V) beta subunit